MRRFSPDYFDMSSSDRRDVTLYLRALIPNLEVDIKADELKSGDDLACARLYTGRPLSNAFYVHEREELTVLRRLGINPFRRRELDRAIDDGSQAKAHTLAIEAELNYLGYVAKSRGHSLPIRVLPLFNPSLDVLNQQEYIDHYSTVDTSQAMQRLRSAVRRSQEPEWEDISPSLISRELRRSAQTFFAALIAEEPLWKVVASDED